MGTDRYVGRGGEKLKFALDALGLPLSSLVVADFGCSIGGFTDCMLQAGAVRVYAVDTGYGMLEWKLRNDERVVVMERTNALHVELPEPMDFIACDVSWTPQRHILPAAIARTKPGGAVLSLLKPQYEVSGDRRRHGARLRGGVVSADDFEAVLRGTVDALAELGINVRDVVRLPHEKQSKNPEAFLHVGVQGEA